MRFLDRLPGGLCCLVLGFLVLCGCFAGCGPSQPKIEYADVAGKVTYKGEALKMGTVSFQPASGARAVGDIQPDGTYKLKGVVGPNTVMIESHEPSAKPGGPEAEKMMKSDAKTYIPMSYASNASGLKFEVKKVKVNTADFDLK
jgi:hypothetical protein